MRSSGARALLSHALLIDCMPPFESKLVPPRNPAIAFIIANTDVKLQLRSRDQI